MMTIDLRPASFSDEELLFSVYAGTRAEEMDLVDWNAAQKHAFLRMQFRARDQFYKENYSGAEDFVILVDGQPVGRLYLHRRSDELRIMDIALLPEFCGRGIGTALLKDILGEAENRCVPVTIHVERFNPALSLYRRLGFRLAEERGMYLFMKWHPSIDILEPHENTGSIAEY